MSGGMKMRTTAADLKWRDERIATLEAELKARDLAIKCLLEGKKELQGELAKETFICTHCGYHNKKGK